MENSPSWTLESDLEDLDIDLQDYGPSLPPKRVPNGDIFEASRAGDVDRLRYLLETGVNVNARDRWDSVALYYACLTGRLDAARLLLENGAICSEHTFDGDRCHYASLNLRIRKLLKAFEARPPPLAPLQASLRDTFLGCRHNRAYLKQDSDANVDVSGMPSPRSIKLSNPIQYMLVDMYEMTVKVEFFNRSAHCSGLVVDRAGPRS